VTSKPADIDELGPGDPGFEAILDERAKALAVASSAADRSTADSTHLVVESAGIRFALAKESISRILVQPKTTRIPSAPSGLEFVIHADGKITSVIDLSRLVDDGSGATKIRDSVVLAESHGRRLGLFVDRIVGLERILDEAITGREGGADAANPIVGTTAQIVVVVDVPLLVDGAGRAAPT